MSIHSFPRCSGYLKAMNVRLEDPEMTDYWCAVMVADAFTDEDLAAVGTINFETMNGDQLLTEFEKLLASKRAAIPSLSHADMESLKAFFGSRGVKASALKSAEDFWHCASILWPDVVKKNERGPLVDLLSRIRDMSKKHRQIASQNISKIPTKWRARAS
ncbi:hypothetical protein [Chelativorans sp. Marseille-P2723]|uniref:hypothetical protein n=1 Tax=Chelativorans sp. Marseille-P2723 TaxID=2709133 RepID=UPI00156D9717|nr:hypothetical protein [Chelativorans sp. Marseille-P2723]